MTQDMKAGGHGNMAGRDLTIIYEQHGLKSLQALHPIKGARLLAQMASDPEMHSQAASLLYATEDDDKAAKVLTVLLDISEDLTVSLLAGLDSARVQKLIDAAGEGAEWLASALAAAHAIEMCEIKMGARLGHRIGGMRSGQRPSTGEPDGKYYWQAYERAQVYWAGHGDAQATTDAIGRYHSALGGAEARLGVPVAPAAEVISPAGTTGTRQDFEGGRIYWSDQGGVHATWGGIDWFHGACGGCTGSLGFPVGDEAEVHPIPREAGDGDAGWCQRFEGGIVFWSRKTDQGVMVLPPVAEYLDRNAGAAPPVGFPLGFPVSPPMETAESRYGTQGYLQRFEGHRDYPEDILEHWSSPEGRGGAAVYWSERHGAHAMGHGNGELYERDHGPSGLLGFPVSDEIAVHASQDEPYATIQGFEGGRIYYKDGYGSIAVSGEVHGYIQERGLARQFGFPVSAEEPLGTADGRTAQFFEGGIVTIREGLVEAWAPAQPGPVSERGSSAVDGYPPSRPGLLVPVFMPQLGESCTEGTVTRWLKKYGEYVYADEPLLEVSTDKVDTEVPSPATGLLTRIDVDEDETVAVGAILAEISVSPT